MRGWIGYGNASLAYRANAVHFDGTTLVSGGAFASDSPYGLMSVWSKSAQGICFIDKPDSGNFAVILGLNEEPPTAFVAGTFYDASNNNYWNHGTWPPFSYDGTQWKNTLLSWDMNHAAGSRIVQVYISDVAQENDPSGDVGGAFSVDLTTGQTFLFRDTATFYGPIVGDVADFYFDSSFLDLSVVANRRKFIDANGKPVYLGANGEGPTGSAPQIFLSGDSASFVTNKGIGPSFTQTESLTNASTSPSD